MGSVDSWDALQRLQLGEASPPELLDLGAHTVVDTVWGMRRFLQSIRDLPLFPPQLYLDCEGLCLGRYGELATIQVYVLSLDHTYIIDVFVLRELAFHTRTSNQNATTWAKILSSPIIPKVIWAGKNDVEAIFFEYDTRIQNLIDVQILELACRSGFQVVGLEHAVAVDANLNSNQVVQWKKLKQQGKKVFFPRWKNGRQVSNVTIRPLTSEVLKYCVGDVKFLGALWKKYDGILCSHCKEMARLDTLTRLQINDVNPTAPYVNPKHDTGQSPRKKKHWPKQQSPKPGE